MYVALASILSIGLALGAGIGISIALHYEWTYMGMMATFLILGVGVDNMFIILRTMDRVASDPENIGKGVDEVLGCSLKVRNADSFIPVLLIDFNCIF